MSYIVRIKPAASRQLEKLPSEIQRRILSRIESLKDDPFPPGCKKLAAVPDAWRVRTGSYRIIYQVHQGMLVILILALGHRKNIYR